jgi:hypothetical protein
MDKWTEQSFFQMKNSKWPEKHIKKCLTSLAIKEMQIQTMLRFHFTSSKNTNSNKCCQRCKEKEPSYTVGGNVI